MKRLLATLVAPTLVICLAAACSDDSNPPVAPEAATPAPSAIGAADIPGATPTDAYIVTLSRDGLTPANGRRLVRRA